MQLLYGINVFKKIIKNKKDYTLKDYSFSGEGTAENPYNIETIEDLVVLGNNVNNGKSYEKQYFILVNKLDFLDKSSYKNAESKEYGDINRDGKVDDIITELTTGMGFEPIGEENVFLGNFNGNGKIIKNYNVNLNELPQYNCIGIFGKNGGTISDLKVAGNINIIEKNTEISLKIGLLCAENTGILESCKVEGDINVDVRGTATEVAGISAINTGNILNCVNNANIISNQEMAGIVARSDSKENSNSEITNCTNTGKIKEMSEIQNYAAGIVANNVETLITSCNNNGRVEGNLVGGIAGISTGKITACQNASIVLNTSEEVNFERVAGGIVGQLEKSIVENCKNTGEISGNTNIGGIAGKSSGEIVGTVNEGAISKESTIKDDFTNIGGIVGANQDKASISDSKNYGNISAETDNLVILGGICGLLYNNSLVENCENYGNLSGQANEIIPNEDLNDSCKSCLNFGRGTAQSSDAGTLYLGLIYGKILIN